MRGLLVVAALPVLVVATDARAGSRTTRIGIVNRDANPKAKRFGFLKAGLEAAIQAGAGGVIEGVVVIPEASVARWLRPQCGLAMPWEQWKKLETSVEATAGEGFLDYVVVYCADAARTTVTWNVFEASSTTPFMSVTLRPTSDSVGRPAVDALARVILELSQMRFSP